MLQRDVTIEDSYLTCLSVLTKRSSMYSGVGVKAERGKTDKISAASFPCMMSLWIQSRIAERAGSVPAWATESRKASLHKIFRTVMNTLMHIPYFCSYGIYGLWKTVSVAQNTQHLRGRQSVNDKF